MRWEHDYELWIEKEEVMVCFKVLFLYFPEGAQVEHIAVDMWRQQSNTMQSSLKHRRMLCTRTTILTTTNVTLNQSNMDFLLTL
jgi:glycerol kinase